MILYTIKLTQDEMCLVHRAIGRLQGILGTNLATLEAEGDPQGEDLLRAQRLCEDIGVLDSADDKLLLATGETA